MKTFLKTVLTFLAGNACYLWLAILEVPFFRLNEIEPAGLIHALVESGGWETALLFVAFFWGVAFAVTYLVYSALFSTTAQTPHRLTLRQVGYGGGLAIIILLATGINLSRHCFPKSTQQQLDERATLVITLLQTYKEQHGQYPKYLYQLREDMPGYFISQDDLLTDIFNTPSTYPLSYNSTGSSCTLRYPEPCTQGESFREIVLKE